MLKKFVSATLLALAMAEPSSADTIIAEGKMTGKLPECSFSYSDPDSQAAIYGYFSSVLGPGGVDAVLVYWEGTWKRLSWYVFGMAPMDSVKVTGDTIRVDFDTDKFLWKLNGAGTLTGTFAICSAPGTHTESIAGDISTRTENQCWDGSQRVPCTYATRATGVRLSTSATFTGTLGPVNIPAPASGCNGEWFVQKGQRSFTLTVP